MESMPGVRISVVESDGIARIDEPFRIGIPLPRGFATSESRVALLTAGQVSPCQWRTLARWPDASIKWLLLDARVTLEPRGQREFVVEQGVRSGSTAPAPAIRTQMDADTVQLDTGVASVELSRKGPFELRAKYRGKPTIAGTQIVLRGMEGRKHAAEVDLVEIEEDGPLRAVVACTGHFNNGDAAFPLRFTARISVFADTARAEIEFLLLNPRAAHHIEGIWDLGDPSSVRFEELALEVTPSSPATTLRWRAEEGGTVQEADPADWLLYQDSSGGQLWNSHNHQGADGRLTVQFQGYKVRGGPAQSELGNGRRATPAVQIRGSEGWVAATVSAFWQNFPKALAFQNGRLRIGLFPAECCAPFELQGGEQKRHTVSLECGDSSANWTLPSVHHPLAVSVHPADTERSKAVLYCSVKDTSAGSAMDDYVGSIVEGPHAFAQKREIIDEYGWRNFGDLYADHEAVRVTTGEPLVSHYNNQYDFILGAGISFLRSGDQRWWRLMRDAALHTVDIDIYHTADDRPAFNCGLFWHTDHYKDAARCTHRTYSASNAGGESYGGGPSSEHNYTSGLLLYHYLTGDAEARKAVVGLADWVIAMDDGSRTILGLLTDEPTGAASRTVSDDYHKPGRGAGNSINALLDAYSLSGERRYLRKAEALIERCIHPLDDIEALGLSAPEYRWSYLVFLQSLGKYLDLKLESGETDYGFHYARESLQHYASWMLVHEVPYKDVLHKVELPTETWPAQDVRKCHVMHLAARFGDRERRQAFRDRAGYFFERCLSDLLGFPTAYLTRPQVLLCVHGGVHAYFLRNNSANEAPDPWQARHNYDFGTPVHFIPQRAQAASGVRARVRVVQAELGRFWRDGKARIARKVRKAVRAGP